MMNDIFTPDHLKQTVLQLLRDDERALAWNLIDHFIRSANRIDHFDVLGYLSLKAEKRDTYLKCAEAAYSLAETPDQLFNARTNLYKAYNTMNRPEDALLYIEQNLRTKPNDFETLCQKAFNTSLMGEKEDAEQMLLSLVAENPDKAHKLEAAFSGKYLREGHTSKGILSFVETFKPVHNFFESTLNMKRWKGESDSNKIIYVDIEGGIGDQLINIRFFDNIKEIGMLPILVSQDTTHYQDINKLLTRHGHQVITDRSLIDRTQYWSPMMSLPGYLALTESQLWKGPYITPLRSPKNKLASVKAKIGIKCSGNPFFAQDEYRKIPIDHMLSVLPDDVEIYYIDKEPQRHSRVIDLSDRIDSWEDTLDFIDQMDCIVSSCTSLVHAAGAMGKTTFVAVPIAEYYIWTTTKRDGSSPWYGGNFYVARQTKVRDWKDPLNDIGQRVSRLLEGL